MSDSRQRAVDAIRRSPWWSVFWSSDADLMESGGGNAKEILSHAPITLGPADRDAVAALEEMIASDRCQRSESKGFTDLHSIKLRCTAIA